jgi:hypothetical protein
MVLAPQCLLTRQNALSWVMMAGRSLGDCHDTDPDREAERRQSDGVLGWIDCDALGAAPGALLRSRALWSLIADPIARLRAALAAVSTAEGRSTAPRSMLRSTNTAIEATKPRSCCGVHRLDWSYCQFSIDNPYPPRTCPQLGRVRDCSRRRIL